jgi:hypothetical protein
MENVIKNIKMSKSKAIGLNGMSLVDVLMWKGWG